MIFNLKIVTQAVEDLLKKNLSGYTIERNVPRNTDPNKAARDKGWIGIHKGETRYEPHTTGNSPYLVSIDIMVEIQAAGRDGADVEDRLEDAVQEVAGVLLDRQKNPTGLNLNRTVQFVEGFDVERDMNEDGPDIHWQAAIITIHAKARA